MQQCIHAAVNHIQALHLAVELLGMLAGNLAQIHLDPLVDRRAPLSPRSASEIGRRAKHDSECQSGGAQRTQNHAATPHRGCEIEPEQQQQ